MTSLARLENRAQKLSGTYDQRIIERIYGFSTILTNYDRQAMWRYGRTAMKHLVRTPKNIGHAIREARKAKSLTQTDLAAMSGVWQETISKIENGSGGTKLETIFELLAALDLELTVTERSKGASDGLEDIF
jgi:HTH-type transcriptional regulator/antitoxin HipB